jgi:hypothetical protein
VQARRRPLHCASGSIPWARMLQALYFLPNKQSNVKLKN